MSKVLSFIIEVEDDQEAPEVGEVFDVVNANWHLLDAKYAGTIEDRGSVSALLSE